jgi:predicted ATPase
VAVLRRVILKGFKSIKEMDLELRALNVLIGANGAGKSNLVSFFKMLNEMMAGRLQQYIATTGRAQSMLYFGAKVTPELQARLEFMATPAIGEVHGVDAYVMRLAHAVGDTLVFAEETLHREDFLVGNALGLGMAHLETRIGEIADRHEPPFKQQANALRDLLNHCRAYHFHDTSPTARVRQYSYIGDNRSLLADAGNLAPFLLRLRDEENNSAYQRIVTTIRLMAPFFDDFDLRRSAPSDPNRKDLALNWRDRASDQVFGPHQLSDGTLRAMCLVSLLLQPVHELPDIIVVDEPELGLHPYALNLIASLFKKAANHTQVIISTQSASFLDNFDPEDVIVVDRAESESHFLRPDAASLAAWLDEYSLGEVWEKNVIGGGPH